MFELIRENWTELSLTIAGIGSFFAGRKSKKNNDQAGELENIQKVREIEKSLLSDMDEQIRKLIQTNNTLEAIIERQSKKIRRYEVKYGYLNTKDDE